MIPPTETTKPCARGIAGALTLLLACLAPILTGCPTSRSPVAAVPPDESRHDAPYVCPGEGDFYNLTYPDGGEVFSVGDTVWPVFCSSNEQFICDYYVNLSVDEGRIWFTLDIETTQDTDMRPFWVIPDEVVTFTDTEVIRVSPVSEQCLMKVLDYGSGNVYDISAGYFTIRPPRG
jgi:hypothetical protein